MSERKGTQDPYIEAIKEATKGPQSTHKGDTEGPHGNI
jgi:hypothetical protein